jgi:predicted GNAT family acetyltransferase
MIRPADVRETPAMLDFLRRHEARSAALVETQGFAPEAAMEESRRDVQGWQAAQSHRILWREGGALSVAGVNARMQQVVQIGGVYTPPALRNQGHARRAVAMLLQEARQSDTRRAVLFAMSDHVARAYTAIGFRPSHSFGLCLFATPVQVTA